MANEEYKESDDEGYQQNKNYYSFGDNQTDNSPSGRDYGLLAAETPKEKQEVAGATGRYSDMKPYADTLPEKDAKEYMKGGEQKFTMGEMNQARKDGYFGDSSRGVLDRLMNSDAGSAAMLQGISISAKAVMDWRIAQDNIQARKEEVQQMSDLKEQSIDKDIARHSTRAKLKNTVKN
jgi:PleD family two-component response regulator